MSPTKNSTKKSKSQINPSPDTLFGSNHDRHSLPKIGTAIFMFGWLFIALGVILLALIYYPVIKAQVAFWILKPNFRVPVELATVNNKPGVIHPADPDFAIVIPKIHANAKIVANVDPYNSQIYQTALTKGVAQAQGTVTPDRIGNMFLFSHSSVNFYEAARFNSVFYLADKLAIGDTIYIFYKGKKYIYHVNGTKIVQPSAVSYLSQKTENKSLTLMTCWPAGTSLKRLLIFAQQSK